MTEFEDETSCTVKGDLLYRDACVFRQRFICKCIHERVGDSSICYGIFRERNLGAIARMPVWRQIPGAPDSSVKQGMYGMAVSQQVLDFGGREG